MTDINKVIITGFLCKDVELRFTPTGTKTVNLRVAIHRKYKTKIQELKAETEFFNVIVWNTTAENCAKYLKKGSRIFVEGRLQTRQYIDTNQIKQNITEIIAETVEFLDMPDRKEDLVKE